MRKRLFGATLGVAVLGLLASPAWAGSQAPEAKPAKTKKAAKGKTFQLHGVRWYRGLDASRAHPKASQMPVIWLRVLGDPTGNT